MTKKQDNRPIAAGQLKAEFGGVPLEGNRFVFTAAQNNTYLHDKFFHALLNYCNHNKAQLVVAKFHYNKNAFQNLSAENDDGVWYDQRLEPYFLPEQATVAPDLIWCGELDILPTAVNPLSGLDNYTRDASCIVPHTKVQMKSVPTMKNEPTKFMYTTGAVTLRNYIPRKAGQKASFHHMFAALLVEIDEDGDWFARQLIANNDGEFQDFTTKYSATGVTEDQRVKAIHYGDIHAELPCPPVATASWAYWKGSMLDTLRPEYQFADDLTDFRPRNHHSVNDPHKMAEFHFGGMDNVEAGLAHAALWIKTSYRPWCKTIVKESNHDQALMRWLKDPRGAADAENAYYWHRLNAWVHDQYRMQAHPYVFEYAVRALLDDKGYNVRFLREDESFEICRTPTSPGIECGMHGHRGPNGARGNIRNLRNIGKRANIGHSHEAGIVDGVFQSGVSAPLDMGYNVGPSSWSHTHIVTYPNGKRTLVTIRNGKWRAL